MGAIAAAGCSKGDGPTREGTAADDGGSAGNGQHGDAAAGGSVAGSAGAAGDRGGSAGGGSGPPAPAMRSGGAACKGIPDGARDPLAAGAKVSAKVAVGAAGACTIASDFVGANYVAFPGWGADVSMSAFQKSVLADAGARLLRYPGGAPGDYTDLLMTDTCQKGEPPNWGAPAYGALWEFARSFGARGLLLQTNPTPQWCKAGEHDASGAHAADVARDAARLHVPVVYEVGNEPDLGDSWFVKNGGADAYTAKFIEHAKAIHDAAPGAEVYGPAVCGLGGNCSFPVDWDTGYLDKFLAATGNRAMGAGKGVVDGVSFHVYWHPEWGFTDLQQAKIDKYGFALYWANTVMPYLRALIAKHDTRDLPIVLTEVSLGNGIAKDAGQKQNMFSVLGTLDVIGAFAVSGLRSFQWFDANAEGPSDFWIATKTDPKPLFYAFAAWARMGNVVADVTSSARHQDVATYATKSGDGAVQVLVVNKTASAHDVELSFDGFDPKGKAVRVDLVSPQTSGTDTSAGVLWNGAANPMPGKLPSAAAKPAAASVIVQSVPAFSAAVVSIGP
jgi:hypothetical protein